MPWARQPSLYEIRNEWSNECPVMAMPYLPDDGSPHGPEAWPAMRAQTGGQVDWIGGNVVSRAGLPLCPDEAGARRGGSRRRVDERPGRIEELLLALRGWAE
jgi:hypothetical protein